MSKIDLTSHEWTELVFQGKNKAYGAYKLRGSSDKRHNIAMLFVIAIVVVGFTITKLVELFKSDEVIETEIIGPTKMATFKPAEVKDNHIKKVESVEPPPPLKNSVKFTAPVIKDDKDVSDQDELKSQDEVNTAKGIISIATVVGGDDVNGADIADLKEVVTQVKEEPTYDVVEQMPSFPGGEQELMEFIGKNLKYPAVAAENGVSGKVIVRFVVSKTGHVEKVEVIRSLDPACDREAIRVVKMLPPWIPGKQNGEAVQVYYTLPISYKLQGH